MSDLSTYERLYARYGAEIVPLPRISHELGISKSSCRSYVTRGVLPVRTFKRPGSNRNLVSLKDVAYYVDTGKPRRRPGRPRKRET